MDRRGFTLVEILVAACVLSIVGMLALPTVWRAGQVMRLESEAARLAAALMKHREVIMSRQAAHSSFASASGETTPIFTLSASEYYVQNGTARREPQCRGNQLFLLLTINIMLMHFSLNSVNSAGDAVCDQGIPL